MNTEEQKNFVCELSAAIADDICKQVDAGKIPTEWDGIELRNLLKYRHSSSARMYSGTPQRIRNANNVILVNDL
jgi:hypothetical protein